MAGNIAEMLASCGTYSKPSTASPIRAPAMPCDISENIGTAATNNPPSDSHHTFLRPMRSDSVPENGSSTIIDNMLMSGSSDRFTLMPSSFFMKVGI